MDIDGILALIIILALTVGLVFRPLAEWTRRDSESTDASGVLRRDSESTSKTDDASGEGNEAFNPSRTEYDVFLSFRGRDTRDNFTDCLYHELRRFGVRVFLDNEELRVGKEIGGELLNALNKSRIYIPIFSLNYATSSWCLREVAHMERCTSTSDGKKEILPIFYDVDADDIKLKTELYKNAIPKHEEKFGRDELKRWEAALVKVAYLKGWDLKGKREIQRQRQREPVTTDSCKEEAMADCFGNCFEFDQTARNEDQELAEGSRQRESDDVVTGESPEEVSTSDERDSPQSMRNIDSNDNEPRVTVTTDREKILDQQMREEILSVGDHQTATREIEPEEMNTPGPDEDDPRGTMTPLQDLIGKRNGEIIRPVDILPALMYISYYLMAFPAILMFAPNWLNRIMESDESSDESSDKSSDEEQCSQEFRDWLERDDLMVENTARGRIVWPRRFVNVFEQHEEEEEEEEETG